MARLASCGRCVALSETPDPGGAARGAGDRGGVRWHARDERRGVPRRRGPRC